MKKNRSLLKDLFSNAYRRDPPGTCASEGQAGLADTIRSVLPLNSMIAMRAPGIRSLRFGLASLLLSLVPVAFFGMALVISPVDVTRQDAVHGVFLFTLSMLGFGCVHIGYSELRSNSPSLVRLSGSPAECDRMSRYFTQAFSTRIQLAFCALCILYVWAIFSILGFIPISLSDVLVLLAWGLCGGVLIGNGVYWALITPQYVFFTINSSDLAYDKLAPADTPGVRSLSSMLATYALMNTVVVCVIVLAFTTIDFPGGVKHATWMAWLHALAGGSLVAYSFVYPQIHIVRLVRELKADTELQMIDRQQRAFAHGDTNSEELKTVFLLLDRVREAKGSPLAARVVFKYGLSALVALATLGVKSGGFSTVWSKLWP